jgi:hypothetical protein
MSSCTRSDQEALVSRFVALDAPTANGFTNTWAYWNPRGTLNSANKFISKYHIQGVYAWDTNDQLSGSVGLKCPLCVEVSNATDPQDHGDHGYLKGNPTEQLLEAM